MSERPSNVGMGFGDKLRSLRERAGLTQEELAERAGLTPHAISALERGTRTRPYPHTVRSLADALDLSDGERAALIGSVPKRRTGAAVEAPQTSPDRSAQRAGRRVDFVVPPTPLFGRDHDVAEVSRLARSANARLITLTGPGGVGKTRLAVEVSEQLAQHYPGGVVLIALSALADANEVVGTIGRALHITSSNRSQALELVTAHLTELRLLLVLDNFEHLLSAGPDLGLLASSCPELTMIVTSRAPLRVRGEREFAVGPLSLPTGDVRSADVLAESASGAFVLQRASELSPLLTLDDDEIRALGQLCHRLSGLPLAIELATAHLRLLTPQALLERLDHLSGSGARDLPVRQQSMRATLDWSYRLLSAEQQLLFRLLGVFRGGATLAAVEEVAAASGMVHREDVLGLLGALVEHSLVVVRPGGDLARRYDMLEPVAQYARTLPVADEARDAVRGHMKVFRTLAEAAAIGYEASDQLVWLDRVQADEANILVAIDRAFDSGDPDTAGRITWAMWLYWWLRSQPSVGRSRATRCLTADLSPPVRARVHLAAATMCYAGGDLAASAEHWENAFHLGMQQKDPEIACAGRAGTGLAALGTGDIEAAETFFREALPLGEQAGDSGVWLRSLVHVWLGTILLLKNEPRSAVVEIEQGLQLARKRGDRLATYVALYNLAQAAIALDDHSLARGYLTEGIELSQQTHDLANLAYFLEALAVVESAENAPHRVAVLLGAAQTLRETIKDKIYGYYLPDESLRTRAEQQARRAMGEDAYDDALDTGRALDLTETVLFARTAAKSTQ